MKDSSGIYKMLLLSKQITIFLAQCTPPPVYKKEDDTPVKQNERLSKVIISVAEQLFLYEYMLDENGNPISGSSVKTGDEMRATDSKEYFVFEELSLNKDFTEVKAERIGYMKGVTTIPTSGGKLRSALGWEVLNVRLTNERERVF